MEIYKGQTPAQEISEDFQIEITGMLKRVALEHGIPVERLKFTVDNQGIVNIQSMTEQEMIDKEHERLHNNKVKKLLALKGLN